MYLTIKNILGKLAGSIIDTLSALQFLASRIFRQSVHSFFCKQTGGSVVMEEL